MKAIFLTILIAAAGCSSVDSSENIMENKIQKIWFDGSLPITCSLADVDSATTNMGTFFEGMVGLMPGITSAVLQEANNDKVVIETNEGIMTRSNIKISKSESEIKLEYDEKYAAGNSVTATSHFTDTYTKTENGVTYKLQISNVVAPGFLGFFYRNFASKNIGKGILESTVKYLQ